MNTPPVFSENMSVNEYVRQMELYHVKIKSAKYDLILEILNKLMKLREDTQYNTLTLIKCISKANVTKNLDFSNKLLKEYSGQIHNLFNIKVFNGKNILDNKNNNYILTIIRKMLVNIGYELSPYTSYGKSMYMIKNKN